MVCYWLTPNLLSHIPLLNKNGHLKITTTIFSSVFAPQLNTDACTDTFFSLCTQKCVHVMEFWPMSFKWSCYMRMYGHHFKGSNDTAIIFMLFLQLAFWSTALISGVSPVYLDHEDKTHNTGMVELRVGRRLCFWWFREAAIATFKQLMDGLCLWGKQTQDLNR